MIEGKERKKRKMSGVKAVLITAVSCTWGILQTLAGFIVFLCCIRKSHEYRSGVIYTPWEDGGVSLGFFVFSKEMTEEERLRPMPGPWEHGSRAKKRGGRASETSSVLSDDRIMPDAGISDDRIMPDAGISDDRTGYELFCHEYGHVLQSAMLGPLYLPVIGLPSLLWNRLPFFCRLRKERGISYYTFYSERWADRLGGIVPRRRKRAVEGLRRVRIL